MTAHVHRPQAGTLYKPEGLPASLDYQGTIEAVCGGCGEPIRRDGAGSPWVPKYAEVITMAERKRS